jgi:hypothetical protein
MNGNPSQEDLNRLVDTLPVDEFADLLLAALTRITPAAQMYLLERLRERIGEQPGAAHPAPRRQTFAPPQYQDRAIDALSAVSGELSLLSLDSLTVRMPAPFVRRAQQTDQLIVLEYAQGLQVPAFQFGTEGLRDGEVLYIDQTVGRTNRSLQAGKDPWGAVSWWAFGNGRIQDGAAPASLVGTDREHLLPELAASLTELVG